MPYDYLITNMEEQEQQYDPQFIQTLLKIDFKQYEKYRYGIDMLKPFNILFAMHTHDIEKTLYMQRHELIRQLGEDHEMIKKYDKLIECVDDAGESLRQGDMRITNKNDKILKKYSHNILSVLSDNQLLLSTKTELLIKDEVGNKAFKLWEMAQMKLNVPPAVFLTFAACRLSYGNKNGVVPGMLHEVMYFFKGEPVAIRSSGLLSMPGVLDTIYVEDSSNYEKICEAIHSVIGSWYNEKAVKYRKLAKIDDTMQIGVIIQKLVKATSKNGFSGTAYSRNPVTGEAKLSGEVLHQQMGNKLASGEVTPEDISTIDAKFQTQLYNDLLRLEEKNRQIQYVEFASDGEELYMLQDRDAKVSEYAKAVSTLDFFKRGWIDSTRFERLYNDFKFKDDLSLRKFTTDQTPLTTGIASSSGILTGQICLDIDNSDNKLENIWFTDITTVKDLNKIERCDAIVTMHGGYTSHPAEISRMKGIPSIVSAKGLQIFADHITINGVRYNEGQTLTIVGDTGEIFLGKVEVHERFILDEEYKQALNENL